MYKRQSEHNIGGVRGTKEALRWAFDKAKPGDVSGLYECGVSDHLMVVGLVAVSYTHLVLQCGIFCIGKQ